MKGDDSTASSPSGWSRLARSFLENETPLLEDLPQFGDYVLEEEIARGAMGIVYRAWHLSLDRPAAVKVMREGVFASGREVERFRQEAAAAASLRHPGIVPVFESGECGGRYYYVMEWIAGPNMAEVTRGRPAAARQAAKWTQEVARAIAHAHALGVIHRDLKPANVLVDPEGRARVTDFGMARRTDAAGGLTLSGEMLGTPGYMAPEVAAGRARDAGAAVDVYGLGALLFHLLTGRAPFIGESQGAVLQQMAESEPVPPRLLNASVPRDLETICLKALSADPDRRYESAETMAADLDRFLSGEPILARPLSVMGRAAKWCRRKPALALSLTGVVLSLTAVAGVSLISARSLKSSRDKEAAARVLADRNAERAEMNLYAADMKAAWQHYQEGAVDTMIRRLQEHVPLPGSMDPRGIEWYLLDRLSQGDQTATVTLPGPVEDACFSDDARWCVISGGGRARLLETGSQQERLHWTEAVASTSRRLAQSPAGHLLAMSSASGLYLLDPEKGSERLIHPESCEAIAFSRDGAWLAAGNVVAAREEDTARHRVRIFSAADWSLARELPMYCRGLAWDGEGRLVVCDTPKGSPGRMTWIDPAVEQPVRQFTLNPERSGVRAAWLNTKADRLLAQLGNLEMVFGTMSTGQILLRRPGFSMEQAAMEDNGNRLVFAGQDQALRLWSTVDGEYGPSRRGHTGRVLAMAFTLGGQGMRSIAADGTLRSWNLQSDWQASLYSFRNADALTGVPLLSPDGSQAALCTGAYVTGQDDSFTLRDLRTRQAGARHYAAPLGWSPDGAWILGLRRSKLILIHPQQSREHVLLELPAAPQSWLPRVSADWKWLAWSADGNRLQVIALPGGRTVAERPCAGAVPAFSPDATRLAVPESGRLALLDLPSGSAAVSSIPAASLVAWSPDGTEIAAAEGTSVRVHKVADGTLRQTLSGHRGPVCSIAWSPDARTLAAGCEDRTVHFWNLATSREALVLPLETPPVLLAFAPDGSALVAGGQRGYRIFETTLRTPPAPPLPVALPLPDPAACAPARVPAAAPDPATDDEVMKRRLRTLWEAAHQYRRQNNRWPDHLSHLRDLLPEPLDRALKSPEAERGSFLYQGDYVDPAYPSPFHYEWCAVLCDPKMGDKDLSWKTDGPLTQREYAEHARARYGDKVPFIRAFGTHEEGRLPAVLYDGTLALLPDDWEKAYQNGWRPAPW